MEKQPPNFMQNSLLNPYKSKHNYPQKAKGMSNFFAFVFSIFIYISIFYIFNLSPSQLFKNTKFWFFISNTLIIIILVDYHHDHHHLHQNYIMRRQTSAPSFHRSYSHISRTCFPQENGSSQVQDFQDFHETRKNTHPRIKIPYSQENGSSQFQDFQETRKHSHQRIKIPRPQENGPSQVQDFQEIRKNRVRIPDNRLPIVPENSHELPKIPRRKKIEKHCTFKIDENKLEIAKKEEYNTSNEGGRDKKKVMMTKTFLRSKSDIVKRVVIDESKNIVRRVETVRYENSSSDGGEEENNNEYTNMSDEELNRRVEEFIQKFNKQIQLQRDVY